MRDVICMLFVLVFVALVMPLWGWAQETAPTLTPDDVITPLTIHATTRQQITFRIKTGRFVYE